MTEIDLYVHTIDNVYAYAINEGMTIEEGYQEALAMHPDAFCIYEVTCHVTIIEPEVTPMGFRRI